MVNALPRARLLPLVQTPPAGHPRAASHLLGQIFPGDAGLEHEEDTGEDAPVIEALSSGVVLSPARAADTASPRQASPEMCQSSAKNQPPIRRLPLPDLLKEILEEERARRGNPEAEAPVLEVVSWNAYASRFTHLFRTFTRSTNQSVPVRFRPSDLRNTLPSEAKQRGWDDALVQAHLGRTWGRSVKDKLYVSLIPVDEMKGDEDPLLARLREEVMKPLNELVEKAKRNCTSLHAGADAKLGRQVISMT